MILLKNVRKFVCCGVFCACLNGFCADLPVQTEISGILKTDKPVWETSAKDFSVQFSGRRSNYAS